MPYFESKTTLEIPTVIILSSWQFSLHDDGERNYRLNNCNCSLSILLLKCFIKHKVDDKLYTTTNLHYKESLMNAMYQHTWMHAYHLNSKNWNGWRVNSCNHFAYSFFLSTMEWKLLGEQDNNDGYLKRVILSQKNGTSLPFVACLSFPLFCAILPIYSTI